MPRDATLAACLFALIFAACTAAPARLGPGVEGAQVAPGEDGREDLAHLVGGERGAQAREALRRITVALTQAGGDLEHVVRTRLYVTDISRWEEVGRAHGEFFGSIRPATSMVEVSRLISPGMLVEIEADAIVATEPGPPGR